MIRKAKISKVLREWLTDSDLTAYTRRKIQWFCQMDLHLLGEKAETWLAEIEWPLCSGKKHYVCVSTGLIFNKETGREVRYSTVSLDLKTLEKKSCSEAAFRKLLKKSQDASDNWHNFRIKPGPKKWEAEQDEEYMEEAA